MLYLREALYSSVIPTTIVTLNHDCNALVCNFSWTLSLLLFSSFFTFSITESILNSIYEHRLYWNCFKFQDIYSETIKQLKPILGPEGTQLPTYKPRVQFKYEGNPKQEVYATRDCYPVQSTDFIRQCDVRLDQLRASKLLFYLLLIWYLSISM